jgi:ribonuclease Y
VELRKVETNIVSIIIIASILLFIGIVFGYWARKRLMEREMGRLEDLTRETIEKAKKEAETKRKELALEAKEKWYKAKTEFEDETKEKRQELQRLEKRLSQKEENVERRMNFLETKEREVLGKEKKLIEDENAIKTRKVKYDQLIEEELKKLEIISGITAGEAKEELKQRLSNEARIEAANVVKKITEEAKGDAERKSKEILSLAIQRCAADHITEGAVTVVDLPNDDMKGRIIGREGRNIRALEMATGIDLIIDDTPEAIVLSGFDPIRREIARISLERLMADGRIHPGRIEEVVNKVKKDMNNLIKTEGEQATLEVGVDGLHPEEIKHLGRLRYRTSYSQNVLQHSKEVANLSGIIAAELGADVKIAKRAGLLHDIGKSVDHQTEGTHTQIGAELATKYNEPKLIVDAIAAHHEDMEATSIEAVILQAADALSAARPGARREMVETYIKRLEKLEHIADNFDGVEKAFAVRAGREIRIIVRPEKISDAQMVYLSQDIAKKIEEELTYPGEIKVTVIRETRSIEYAK